MLFLINNVFKEQVNYLRIKMYSAIFRKILKRIFFGPGITIRTFLKHGVIDIRDCKNPGR